jgi:hypothetical protein
LIADFTPARNGVTIANKIFRIHSIIESAGSTEMPWARPPIDAY